MEAVAAHALRRELPRQREFLRQRRLVSMKSGIEAGHLRNVGRCRGDRTDRADVVRLMQRGEWHERLQRRHNLFVDQNGSRVVQPAVHHAMSDTGESGHAADMRDKPAVNGSHRAVMIVRSNRFVARWPPVRIGDLETGRGSGMRSDAIDLSVRER